MWNSHKTFSVFVWENIKWCPKISNFKLLHISKYYKLCFKNLSWSNLLARFQVKNFIIFFLHFPKFLSPLHSSMMIMMYIANPFQAEYQDCNSMKCSILIHKSPEGCSCVSRTVQLNDMLLLNHESSISHYKVTQLTLW